MGYKGGVVICKAELEKIRAVTLKIVDQDGDGRISREEVMAAIDQLESAVLAARAMTWERVAMLGAGAILAAALEAFGAWLA